MDFCLFQEVVENWYFKEKVMEKSWNFAETVSSVHDIWLWQPYIVHYFLSRCFMRGGHLYIFKEVLILLLKCTFDFVTHTLDWIPHL